METNDGVAAKTVTCGADDALSHNLYGQRLGRKGRDTRDRIIAAAATLIARSDGAPVTLSAVAREASLGMTTLYLYFSDLTELLLAVLEPVMAGAEDAYLGRMRTRWDEADLHDRCVDFTMSYLDFWRRHSRILHLRNSLSDQRDPRMMGHRIAWAQTLINLVVTQMDSDPAQLHSPAYAMAAVLMTGFERVVTIATDLDRIGTMASADKDYNELRLRAVARLLEMGLREHRA